MKLTKIQREELRMKFGGHCAYCGAILGEKWQADHVEPVNRKGKWVVGADCRSKFVLTGEKWNPENDRLDNFFPACVPCNNNKFNLTLEQWRRSLEDLPGVLERNYSAWRHAERFGLVAKTEVPKVVFYFERMATQEGGEK